MKTKTLVFMIENEPEGPRFILEDIADNRAMLVEVDIIYDGMGPSISPLWDLGEVTFDRNIDDSITVDSLAIIEKAPANILVDEALELKDGTTLEVVLEISTF